jgi:hypothetical protein
MSPESDDAQRVTRLIKKIGGWLVMISSLRLCVDAPRKPRLIAGWAASIQPRGGEPQCQGMRSRRQHGYNPPRRAASDELKRYPFLSTTSVLRICQTDYRQNGIALSRPPISVRPTNCVGIEACGWSSKSLSTISFNWLQFDTMIVERIWATATIDPS